MIEPKDPLTLIVDALESAKAALRNWMILHPADCDSLDKSAMDVTRAALAAARSMQEAAAPQVAQAGVPVALALALAKHYREAIATVCEGWTLPADARKVLETALWNPPAAPTHQAALPQQEAPDEKLWAVNVHGPDDLHAMPSKAVALERANDLNVYFGKLTDASTTREYDPIMRAVVIEWDGSAESHAKALAAAPQHPATQTKPEETK